MNLGHFKLKASLIRHSVEVVAKAFAQMNLVVIRCEHRYDTNTFDYTAFSDKFREVPDGECAPEYGLAFRQSDDGLAFYVDVEEIPS